MPACASSPPTSSVSAAATSPPRRPTTPTPATSPGCSRRSSITSTSATQRSSGRTENFDVGFLVDSATLTDLTPAEVAAYDAPFPDDSYKAGARIFPTLVPTSPDDPAAAANRAAWEVFQSWDKPFICCFSDRDPVTAGGDKPFIKLVPGAQGQPHTTVENAHHFFQEDAAPQLAQIIVDAVRA